MKFFRTAIILAIVGAIGGFAYWFFDVKKKEDKKETEEQEALFFTQSEKKVVRLTLDERDREPIILERRVTGPADEEGKEPYEWVVLSPVETGGDTTIIDAIIAAIYRGKREEIVWENLEHESEYELDDPVFSLRFVYDGEETENAVHFGIQTLDRKRIFVKTTKADGIMTAPSEFLTSLKKSLFDVRDKRIAPLEEDEIVGVSLLFADQAISVKKEEDTWYLLPDRVKASKARVDMLTGQLRWGSFVQVMDETGENPQEYGIDRPRLVLSFKLQDDSNFLFFVGDQVDEEGKFFFAARSTDGMVFQVQADTVTGLLMDRFYLKDRSIFDLDRENVVAVSIRKDGDSMSFVKKDDGDWYFSDDDPDYPGSALGRGYKIDNIVRGLLTAEYEIIEPLKRGEPGYDDTGIDKPVYHVEVGFKDGKKVEVAITGKDEETGKLFISPDGGETVYHTSGYFTSSIPETKEDLLD